MKTDKKRNRVKKVNEHCHSWRQKVLRNIQDSLKYSTLCLKKRVNFEPV